MIKYLKNKTPPYLSGIAEEIGYKRGYTQGVEDTLQRVSDWIDEETLDYVRERLFLKND